MNSSDDFPKVTIDRQATAMLKPSRSKKNIKMMEAAGLLILWSILVINEGAIRLITLNPSVGLTASGRPPKLVSFLGALFEVFFGLLGTAVGAAAFLLRRHSSTFAKSSLVIQTVLGYYVFAVFVFLIPSYRAADLSAPILEGLTISESRVVIVLGILTSFHFCLALQGGQFVFFARLIHAASGKNFLKQESGNQMRAIFWNVNLALSGLWTLITGAIISSKVGSGRIDGVFMSPPNVGRLPFMTIGTGLYMLLWGILGAYCGVTRQAPLYYFTGSFTLYMYALLNFGIVQFGLIEDAPGGPVAMHNGLVFMVAFIGPYFVSKAHEEVTE